MKINLTITNKIDLTPQEFLIVGLVVLGIYGIAQIAKLVSIDPQKKELTSICGDATDGSMAYPIGETCTSGRPSASPPCLSEAIHGRNGTDTHQATRYLASSCRPCPLSALPYKILLVVYTISRYQWYTV